MAMIFGSRLMSLTRRTRSLGVLLAPFSYNEKAKLIKRMKAACNELSSVWTTV
jgi:hypothetical protein